MSLFIKIILQAFLFAGFILPSFVWADAPLSKFARLHQRYAQLASTDRNFANFGSWSAILTSFDNLSEHDADYLTRAKAHFAIARINESLYRKKKTKKFLKEALARYSNVYSEHAESELADDSLLFAARLYGAKNRDRDVARQLLRRIVNDYPESELGATAEEELLGLGATASKTTARSRAKRAEKKPVPKRVAQKTTAASSKVENSLEKFLDSQEYGPVPLAKKRKGELVVVIDPGHGGEEEGAIGVDGALEKDIVLEISMILEELLRKRLSAKTMLTRARDLTVTLAERTAFANAAEADLFVSIHTNASRSRRASGIETYYLDNTNDKASLRLSERENAAAVGQLGDLEFMLSDLIQNAKLDDSISLAHHIQDSLFSNVSQFYPKTKNLGVKKAPFFVLVGAHMPCVLVEVSFIDHPTEGKRLLERSYQKLLALSIFQGLHSYLEASD